MRRFKAMDIRLRVSDNWDERPSRSGRGLIISSLESIVLIDMLEALSSFFVYNFLWFHLMWFSSAIPLRASTGCCFNRFALTEPSLHTLAILFRWWEIKTDAIAGVIFQVDVLVAKGTLLWAISFSFSQSSHLSTMSPTIWLAIFTESLTFSTSN